MLCVIFQGQKSKRDFHGWVPLLQNMFLANWEPATDSSGACQVGSHWGLRETSEADIGEVRMDETQPRKMVTKSWWISDPRQEDISVTKLSLWGLIKQSSNQRVCSQENLAAQLQRHHTPPATYLLFLRTVGSVCHWYEEASASCACWL